MKYEELDKCKEAIELEIGIITHKKALNNLEEYKCGTIDMNKDSFRLSFDNCASIKLDSKCAYDIIDALKKCLIYQSEQLEKKFYNL